MSANKEEKNTGIAVIDEDNEFEIQNNDNNNNNEVDEQKSHIPVNDPNDNDNDEKKSDNPLQKPQKENILDQVIKNLNDYLEKVTKFSLGMVEQTLKVFLGYLWEANRDFWDGNPNGKKKPSNVNDKNKQVLDNNDEQKNQKLISDNDEDEDDDEEEEKLDIDDEDDDVDDIDDNDNDNVNAIIKRNNDPNSLKPYEAVTTKTRFIAIMIGVGIMASGVLYMGYMCLIAFQFDYFTNTNHLSRVRRFYHAGSVFSFFLFAACIIAAGIFAMRGIVEAMHRLKNEPKNEQDTKATIVNIGWKIINTILMAVGFTIVGTYALAHAIQYKTMAERLGPGITSANNNNALAKGISAGFLPTAVIIFIFLLILHYKYKDQKHHLKASLAFFGILFLILGIAFLPAGNAAPKKIELAILGFLIGITVITTIIHLVWYMSKQRNKSKASETILEKFYTPILLLAITIFAVISITLVIGKGIDMNDFSMKKTVPWLIVGIAFFAAALFIRDFFETVTRRYKMRNQHLNIKQAAKMYSPIILSLVSIFCISVALYFYSINPILSNHIQSVIICACFAVAASCLILRQYVIRNDFYSTYLKILIENEKNTDNKETMMKSFVKTTAKMIGYFGIVLLGIVLAAVVVPLALVVFIVTAPLMVLAIGLIWSLKKLFEFAKGLFNTCLIAARTNVLAENYANTMNDDRDRDDNNSKIVLIN